MDSECDDHPRVFILWAGNIRRNQIPFLRIQKTPLQIGTLQRAFENHIGSVGVLLGRLPTIRRVKSGSAFTCGNLPGCNRSYASDHRQPGKEEGLHALLDTAGGQTISLNRICRWTTRGTGQPLSGRMDDGEAEKMLEGIVVAVAVQQRMAVAKTKRGD